MAAPHTAVLPGTTAAASATTLRVRLLACALAALLGGVLLAGVGLAHPQALHNATHDTRHALGFPCH